jgi:hypothetical protein
MELDELQQFLRFERQILTATYQDSAVNRPDLFAQ